VISIGKDPTLTGRTYIWDFALQHIQTRPLLGFGYSVFWLPEAPFSDEFASQESWVSPSAHNQLLDLLLGIGFIGTFFFVASLVKIFLLSFKIAYKATDAINLWPLGILSFFILNNVAESYILEGMPWVLYVYVTFSLCAIGTSRTGKFV
jgi:exopolysaccharide production protein ExoQ